MPNDISPSREGKDYRSDQPQIGDASRSSKKPFNVTRQEATLNDLQQRGVDEQTYYKLERAGKGKNRAVIDGRDGELTSGENHSTDTSWHSDTRSSSECSSESDSETDPLLHASPSDRVILSNKPTRAKPGLLGGGDTYRDMDRLLHRTIISSIPGGIGTELGRDIKDISRLGKIIYDTTTKEAETRKAGKYRDEWYRDHYHLQEKLSQLDALNFNDFKREYPEHADYELFDQQKKFLREDYERTIVIMGKLGPQDWHYMKKYDKSREKKFGDLSSVGKAAYVAQWFADGQKGRSDKQLQKNFFHALGELDEKYRKLNTFTFEDFKRECMEHADYELFDQQKKSLMEDCDRKFDIIWKLGPEGLYRMKKDEKRRARRSDR